MTVARIRQLEALFDQARNLAGSARDAFIANACGEDPALAGELRALLTADAQADAPLDRPALGTGLSAAVFASTPALPGQVGHYRIVRLIGEGGMGLVFEAEQANPRRRVALKLLRPGLTSPAALRRFEQEAQLLGRLRHPGIAQVYEAGTAEVETQGVPRPQPFLALELVDGEAVTEFATRRQLSLRQRIALIADVCDAVHHAHQRGVIHRDLKPANILVVEEGSESAAGSSGPDAPAVGGATPAPPTPHAAVRCRAQPKILDFGIARVIDDEVNRATPHTAPGQIVGTLPYMSPEQVGGDGADLDVRTDVYSLGIVLYELLCGDLPHADSSAATLVKRITTASPPRPSVRNRALRGDIEIILLKAIDGDRRRRYASMAQFGQDLQRYLADAPIEARRASAFYVIRKVVARHRLAAALLLAIAVTITAAAVALGLLYRRAEHARVAADERAEALRRSSYFNTVALAQTELERLNTFGVDELLNACPPDLRGWEWRYLRACADNTVRQIRAHDGAMGCGFAPAGDRVMTWSLDRIVRVLCADSGVVLADLATGAMLEAGDVFPDGRRLAVVGRDGDLQVWDTLACERLLRLTVHDSWALTVACAPDGRTIFTGGGDEVLRSWDAQTGALRGTFVGHTGPVSAVAVAPDGRQIASAGRDRRVIVWDVASETPLHVLTGHRDDVRAVAFLPESGGVVSGGDDGRVIVWDLGQGEPRQTFDAGTDGALSIAVSPDGRRIAVSTYLAVRIWDLVTGDEEAPRLGSRVRVGTVDFAPDGSVLLAAAHDGVLRFWNAAPQEQTRSLRGHQDVVRAVAVTSDSAAIISGSRDGSTRVWDALTGARRLRLRARVDWLGGLAYAPGGGPAGRIYTGGFDGRVHVWDAATGSPLGEFAAAHRSIHVVAVSGDDRWLVVAGGGGAIELRLAADPTAAPAVTLRGHEGLVYAADFAPDSRTLVSAGRDGRVLRWDVERGACRELTGHAGHLLAVAWSPDGALIAGGGSEQVVYIWDADTGVLRHALRGHRALVQSLAFAPDSRRLVTGCFGRLIHVWDPRSGRLALTLRGHQGGVNGLAFSPDGRFFVSGSTDGTVKVWEAGRSK